MNNYKTLAISMTKIEALEKDFTELKDIVMKRSYQNLKIDPKILDQWNPSMLSDQKKSLDQHETDFEQGCSRQHCRSLSK